MSWLEKPNRKLKKPYCSYFKIANAILIKNNFNSPSQISELVFIYQFMPKYAKHTQLF